MLPGAGLDRGHPGGAAHGGVDNLQVNMWGLSYCFYLSFSLCKTLSVLIYYLYKSLLIVVPGGLHDPPMVAVASVAGHC